MRWLFVVVGVSVSTAACSLLVSLDGLDDGVGRPDASLADASRPDASRADASTPDVSTPDAHRDSGVDAAVVDSGHAVHDAGVDHATIADAGGSPYVAAVLEAGPYAYWRFEEKSGSVAHDQMGTVHEGAATGSYERRALRGNAGQGGVARGSQVERALKGLRPLEGGRALLRGLVRARRTSDRKHDGQARARERGQGTEQWTGTHRTPG